MSAYGPAFFIKRLDGSEMGQAEQDELFSMVQEISLQRGLTDDDGDPVEPEFYDYGEYEERSVGFLIYSSYDWKLASDKVPIGQAEADEKELRHELLQIGNEIDKRVPTTYAYQIYYVED